MNIFFLSVVSIQRTIKQIEEIISFFVFIFTNSLDFSFCKFLYFVPIREGEERKLGEKIAKPPASFFYYFLTKKSVVIAQNDI